MSRGGTTSHAKDELEVVHFWPEGDGQRMVDALVEAFESEHPGTTVNDRFSGNHGLEIKGRILREDPPPIFVEWTDRNLVPYHEAGALRDLTDLWADNRWEETFVDGVAERARLDGQYLAVPVTIHRLNNLFYHVDLVEEYGVDPAGIADPREFVEVLAAFGDDPPIGMHYPMKDPETVGTLWSNVFIGQFGAEAFETVTRGGEPGGYADEIAEALSLVDEIRTLGSEDAAFLDMVEANRRFLDREAAFMYQGDWAAAEYLATDGFEYGTDWNRVNFPGTDGVYMLGTDAFLASADAPFGDAERSFLEFVGSAPALERINRIKGSIPPRTDIDVGSYPELLREQHRDFTRADQFPAGHAFQVTPETFVEVKAALTSFLADRDVDAAAEALVEAYGGDR